MPWNPYLRVKGVTYLLELLASLAHRPVEPDILFPVIGAPCEYFFSVIDVYAFKLAHPVLDHVLLDASLISEVAWAVIDLSDKG